MIITEIANIIHIITNKDENAVMYRDEKVFADGEDLTMLIKFAECCGEQQVLDAERERAIRRWHLPLMSKNASALMRRREWLTLLHLLRKKKPLPIYIHFQKGTASDEGP
jgi:hypothetical protein